MTLSYYANSSWNTLIYPFFVKGSYNAGYVPEYEEKEYVGGIRARFYKGKRFTASWTYAYLSQTERQALLATLGNGKENLFRAQMPESRSTGTGTVTEVFEGNCFLDISPKQSLFMYSDVLNDYVWSNVTVTITAVARTNS